MKNPFSLPVRKNHATRTHKSAGMGVVVPLLCLLQRLMENNFQLELHKVSIHHDRASIESVKQNRLRPLLPTSMGPNVLDWWVLYQLAYCRCAHPYYRLLAAKIRRKCHSQFPPYLPSFCSGIKKIRSTALSLIPGKCAPRIVVCVRFLANRESCWCWTS